MFKNEKSHSPKNKWEHSTWSSLNWEKNVRHCPIEINWDSLHSQPERNIFNGSRPPVLLLPPPGVGRAGLGVEGEGVAGQTVPRQAAQHRLDGALLGLLQQQQHYHYNHSRGLSSVLLLTSLLDSLSSLIFLAMAWWMKLMSDQWRWCCWKLVLCCAPPPPPHQCQVVTARPSLRGSGGTEEPWCHTHCACAHR